MPQTTANPEQQSAHGEDRPTQAKAARAYQKVKLTESTEDELLDTYATVISQMVHRFVPLVRVTVDVDDLKNIASLALIQAAHGFDPTAGHLKAMRACVSEGRYSTKSGNHNPNQEPYIPDAKNWRIPSKRCV